MFYINTNVDMALKLTELSLDELESVVGRFNKQSKRAGLLRGKIVENVDGTIEIRKCFGNKVLWTKEEG